mgnify:FL=1
MNVNNATIEVLYTLIGECFRQNRSFDRSVSVLGTKFAMNNTAKLCHEGIAHYFPKLADEIGEKCLERYNIDVKYEATPEGVEDYNNPKDIIYAMRDRTLEFQNMLMGCIVIVEKNQDIQCYVDLLDMLKDYNKIVEQTILMVDKVELYGDNMSSYDAHIKSHFWIL